MQVLLDNKKISNFSFIQEGMNSLGYESLNEVFFDVFEIRSNGIDLIKEKKGDFNGLPIIELDLSIDNEVYKNVRFILKETKEISINPNLLDYTKAIVLEKSQPKIPKVQKIKEQPKSKLESVVFKPKKIVTENKQVKKEKTLLEKTKEQFFDSIKGELLETIKEEIKVGIIADLLKDNIQSNFDNIVEEGSNQYKLQKLFSNENNKFRKELIDMSIKIARRESMRFAEGGGGTNATQYANGGVMNGDLTINGNLKINDQTYIKKAVFDVGDGIEQSFIFNHNLNNKNIIVNVQDSITDEIVVPYIKLIDENSLLVEFSFIPDINSYKLIIFG